MLSLVLYVSIIRQIQPQRKENIRITAGQKAVLLVYERKAAKKILRPRTMENRHDHMGLTTRLTEQK